MLSNFKKDFFIIFCIFIFLLPSCRTSEKIKLALKNIKEEAVERTKVAFSKIPFVKKYIHLPPPPEKLYLKTRSVIEKLGKYHAGELFPEEFRKVFYCWKEARELYKNGFYVKAKKKLEETKELAEELLKKVREYKEKLREKALQRLKEIEKKAREYLKKTKEKNRLKVEFYLWKLKELINLENYEEFEKELKHPPF
jgi:gas vesicle protein